MFATKEKVIIVVISKIKHILATIMQLGMTSKYKEKYSFSTS